MRLIRVSAALRQEKLVAGKGVVLAIGNFDGVHLGHLGLICRAQQQAQRLGAPLGLLIFEPHPRKFFDPTAPNFALTSLRTKLRLFQMLGVDLIYLMRFDRKLCEMSAQVFVQEVLGKQLQAQQVLAGQGFRFGHRRLGDLQLLERIGKESKIGVTAVDPLIDPDTARPYSSSEIRQALIAGDLSLANRQLGRPWEIGGRIRYGQQRGQTILGFPTANIDLRGHLCPAVGVYAVRARIGNANVSDTEASWWEGVANLGYRPTFEHLQAQRARLEVHIFDRKDAIYGRYLRVQLLTFMRPEQRFDSFEPLQRQIQNDIVSARSVLRSLSEPVTPGLESRFHFPAFKL